MINKRLIVPPLLTPCKRTAVIAFGKVGEAERDVERESSRHNLSGGGEIGGYGNSSRVIRCIPEGLS